MTAALSRAVMSLAMVCMGESRREWALAMRAEFGAALAEGKPLAFAIGCLTTAWGEMPRYAEGRGVLANYALAIGLLIPMAVLQVASAVGFSSFLTGGGAKGMLLAGLTPGSFSAYTQLGAAPCLLVMWFLLGIGHLRLAWAVVDRDWSRVVSVGALMGAMTATLFILMAVLMLDVTFVILQAAAMAIEFTVLRTVAERQALFSSAASEMPAR